MTDDLALPNQCPECTLCGGSMRLSHIAPERSGGEQRTFECRSCGKAEIYLVELATIRVKQTPTMWRDLKWPPNLGSVD
jgi:hypothetical protein